MFRRSESAAGLSFLAVCSLAWCLGPTCDINLPPVQDHTSAQPPLAITCPKLVHGCTTGTEAQVVVSVHVSRTQHTPLTVTWSIDNTLSSTMNLSSDTPLESDIALTQTLTMGHYAVHVEVNDGTNPIESCDIPVDVLLDQQPPHVTCSVAVDSLSPPNHQLQNVGLSVVATDDCDLQPDIRVQVYSDEPIDGEGDGNTDADAANVAPDTLELRSERSGGGDGRVYLIVVTATDDVGRQDTTACTAVVPHDQSGASIDSVNTQAADAKAAFETDGQAPSGFVLLNP